MAKMILGFMGTGKTTVANLLDADNYLDMDYLIEEKIGMSIADFFAQKGEKAFREIESELLEELIKLDNNIWVSTGGGIVENPRNRQLLKENKRYNVFLSASFDVIYQRIREDKVCQRPLFLNHTKAEFHTLFDKRKVLYQDLAGLMIDVDERTPEDVARLMQCM